MDEKQNAFQINREDNVATALTPLVPGPVELRGDACAPEVEAATEVPMGHKIALRDIRNGEDIVKAALPPISRLAAGYTCTSCAASTTSVPAIWTSGPVLPKTRSTSKGEAFNGLE